MKSQEQKKKVYVAMSGGVDSSVAAALLKKRGFNVVGVFFKPWQPHLTSSQDVRCGWEQDRRDAMAVATVLGIPFKTWDFSKEYKEKVGDYMIETYRRGLTPNPDVMCNKEIKFGLFLKKALAKGADYIATGHYVRLKPKFSVFNSQFSKKSRTNFKILKIKNSLKIINYKLKIAKDLNKDQSYFLWTLTQKQLKHCLFPIGDYIKPQVRAMAKKFGLPTHNKKDSQGVCFIGKLDMAEFLKSQIKPKIGEIKLVTTGAVLGRHDGASYFTIGQRHGLNIGNGKGPYYVASKDIKKNIVYVGEKKDLETKRTKIIDTSWINKEVKFPLNVSVKIRYRTREQKAVLLKNRLLEFKKPAKAVTPGQSAVFYKGEEILGGGIIGSLKLKV